MNKKKLVREKFRTEVFTRDNHKCKVCGNESDKLDAHHITNRNLMPSGGYVKENGITLCPDCHVEAEHFPQRDLFTFAETEYEFAPWRLYKRIGSSFELAFEKSNNL